MIHKKGANSTLLASFFMPKIILKGGDGMDMKKFCDELIRDESIKDIPLMYVFRVVLSVFSLIESGDYFYKEYD